jgi:hypothetical protein
MGRIGAKGEAPHFSDRDPRAQKLKREKARNMATPIGRVMGTSLLRMQKHLHSRAAYGTRAASTFNIDLTGKTAFIAGVADR